MYENNFPMVRAGEQLVQGSQSMSATLMERQENAVTIQVHIRLSRSMLDTEEAIQEALNEAGTLASGEALKQFDTDGSPLILGSTRWTSKGSEPKAYQTT